MLKRFERALVAGNRWLLIILLLAMACIVFANVVLRYTTGDSIVWAEEVARHLMIWGTFLGAGLVLRFGGHVAIDNLHQVVGPADARALRLLIVVGLGVFFLVMAWFSSQYVWATRFQTTADDAEDGGANLAPPQFEQGKARAQAARMVTGRASYTTLERIGRLEDLAADESQPEPVRARAAEEVERIKAGGSVYPSHLRVNAELSLAELNQLAADPAQSVEVRERARVEADAVRAAEQEARAAELEQLAKAALARVKAAKASGEKKPARPALTAVNTGEPVPFPLTAFLATWDDMAEWWTHYDPADVGPALTAEQWARFEETIAGTIAFTDAARAARQDRAEHIA